MKILITGNLGYVGSILVKKLRDLYNRDVFIIGYDTGFFSNICTKYDYNKIGLVDVQYYNDVRNFPKELLNGVDAVVYLAALSNDPMGNLFEKQTLDINYKSAIKIARFAKETGVKRFVFASSCSMYGADENNKTKTEDSKLNPLTPYAKSKVFSESELKNLADENFIVTCLRFATACGMSDCMRLDLVLNDFVATAITTKKIQLLSDGMAWRPIIHINDMSRAIIWALERTLNQGGSFLAINTGANELNFRIKDLAFKVAELLDIGDVVINQNSPTDKRSYKVSFDLFKKLAPDFYPEFDLESMILDIRDGLSFIGFNDKNFRESFFMRLNYLKYLIKIGVLDENLYWK
jgi:nucleoside-diphosphate-sugar epimerase